MAADLFISAFDELRIGVALFDRNFVLMGCNHRFARLAELPSRLANPARR